VLALLVPACGGRPWEHLGSGWRQVMSDHFLLHTDADLDDVTPIVDRLEAVHEALSSSFFAGLTVDRSEVLLFSRQRDYDAVAPRDSTGFYSYGGGTLGSGLLVFSSDRDHFDSVASTAAHELAHKFLAAVSPEVPAWLHEGFAKYVGALNVSDQLVVFDMDDIHGGYVFFADPVPVADLLRTRGGHFHGGERLAHYMTAWILFRQLFGARRSDMPQGFRTFVERVAGARDPGEAGLVLRTTFGVAALGDLDRSIQTFHQQVYSGVGLPAARRSLAVTLKRPWSGRLIERPVDPAVIKQMCRVLRFGVQR
jgi:hypothetical protein